MDETVEVDAEKDIETSAPWCPTWAKVASQIAASFGVVGFFMGALFLWRGLMHNDYAGFAFAFATVFLIASVSTIGMNLVFKKTRMKIWFITAMLPSVPTAALFLFIVSGMVGPFLNSLG